MPIDFNQAEPQKEFAYGPVPSGSRVLLELEIMRPKNESQQMPFVSVSSKKLYMLWVELRVVSGTYEGVKWRENWLLPEGQQRVQLSPGQKTACRISFSRMRAIIEAARRVNPKDDSPQANNRRNINSWLDLNGMKFPARVGIADDGRAYKGRVYWDNMITSIVTPDKEEYAALMQGGEVINPDGAVTGKKAPVSNGYDSMPYDDQYGGVAFPSESPVQDDPF